MKTLMIAAALCTGIMSAQAQNTPTDTKTGAPTDKMTKETSAQKPMTQADNKDCLKTTEAEWKALGLTAEQMTRVKGIQDEHQQACASMKKDGARAEAMADTHEESIKEVLSPTQYESWKKQCTAMATPTGTMEKK